MPTSRRDFLTRGGFGVAALTGASLVSNQAASALADSVEAVGRRPYGFTYALNTGTIRGQKLGLVGEIEATAKAGYDAIEPWLGTIHDFVQSGGSLRDVRQRCQDLGLRVCSGIGFAAWVVDDQAERRAGLEQLKRDMDVLAQIGGTHIAAPPAGANRPGSHLDLDDAAARYAVILELGAKWASFRRWKSGGHQRTSATAARPCTWPPNPAIRMPVSCWMPTTCTKAGRRPAF